MTRTYPSAAYQEDTHNHYRYRYIYIGIPTPYNFQSPNKESTTLALPYASAGHGRRPVNPADWTMERENRPLGRGNTEQQLAEGMYDHAPPDRTRMATQGPDMGLRGIGRPMRA